MSLTPIVSIEGVVSGAPQGADVQLMIASDGPKMQTWLASSPSLVQSPSQDGRFKYAGVAPGHYVITARTVLTNLSGGTGVPSFLSTGDQTLWAQADVTVNGTDASNLSLSLQPALRFGGRIQIDAVGAERPVDVTKVSVRLTARIPMQVSNGQVGGTLMVPSVNARADGAFDIVGVMPGEYTITSTVSGAPDWFLTSAMLDGRDLLDVPLRFPTSSGSVSGVVLTMSTRHSELSGTLAPPAGASAADYAVLAFPA